MLRQYRIQNQFTKKLCISVLFKYNVSVLVNWKINRLHKKCKKLLEFRWQTNQENNESTWQDESVPTERKLNISELIQCEGAAVITSSWGELAGLYRNIKTSSTFIHFIPFVFLL